MMRKYQKGGKIYSYNKGSHYQPNTNNIYFNKEDDKFNPNAVLEHELYHRFQNENNGLQLPEYYNGPLKKPNMIMNDDYQNAYYNRRHVDEQNIYNKIIEKNPDLQFIPRNLLYNGYKTSSGNYIPGTEEMMYEDPTTAEGEARDYENYIIKGGKTMFPNQTINEYKSGGKWIQGAIKNPGRCTPGSPNYDCPEGSPQWRLAQTFKKHHGFHKKEDLKKYQGGGPTTSDSLALYNNAEAKVKFYKNNSDYKDVTKNDPGINFINLTNFKDPKIRQKLIEDANRYSKLKYNKVTQPFINEIIASAHKPLNAKEKATLQKSLGTLKFGTLSGTNLSILGDVLNSRGDTWYNPAAPPIYIHPNIEPQGSTRYYSKIYGDRSDIPYYDPIVIKPSYMKTAADYEYVKKKYPELYKGSPKPKTTSTPTSKPFDPLQSLRNTAPDYTQMLANLKEKQSEAQYQTPPRTLPLNGDEPPVDNGRILYYNYGTPEKEVIENPENYTTPLKRYNANDYIMGKYQGGGNTFDTDPLYSVPLNNTFYKEDTVNRINNETLDNYESKLKHYNRNKKERDRITNNLPFTINNKTFYPNPNLPGINPAINYIDTAFKNNSIVPGFEKNINPFLSRNFYKGDIFHFYDKKNTLGNQKITNYVAPVIDKPIYPKLINFNNTPSTLPLKGSRPFYGPGNTIIGYSDDNMQFYPAQQYTGAPNNPINLQDKELLENPEVLKKYVQSRDSYKFAEGGPFISNSQKINLNLPVYKQPEMKPLQFNKFFVNDKNQNLYIGGVNPRYQNKDFSVGPYMVGVGNTNFQKLPADIGMSGTYHVNDKFDINTNIGQNNVGAGIKYKFAKGGIPNNPGFNALPKYVQKRIINNYKQGGVILNTGGEKHEIYVKTTNRGEGTKGHIMVNHPTMDKGMWDTIDLTQKAGVKTIAQGIESTKKWHKENPYMKNNKYQQGGISYNNLDDVLKRLFG